MKWTTEKPDRAGWWWFKEAGREPYLFEVEADDIENHGKNCPTCGAGKWSALNDVAMFSDQPIEQPE